jgi:hypothetical protein
LLNSFVSRDLVWCHTGINTYQWAVTAIMFYRFFNGIPITVFLNKIGSY